MPQINTNRAVKPRLTLAVRGLFVPAAPAADGAAPALERVLARADRGPDLGTADFESTLLRLFGITPDPGVDAPVAALTRVADAGRVEPGWWLRADPVHLLPGLDQLLMTDNRELKLRPAEAKALVDEILRLFGADGWRLQALHPERWYLTLDAPPVIATTPPGRIIGRSVFPHLPRGRDGKAWHAVLNELQTLLHGAAVNDAREARGQWPVNSLWFWGGGALPAINTAPWARVWGRDPLTEGLARVAKLPWTDPPADVADWLRQRENPGEQLVVLDDGSAPEPADLEWLEQDWMQPLLAALKAGTLERLTLVGETGARFVITSRQARHRWWRRPRPLGRYADFE